MLLMAPLMNIDCLKTEIVLEPPVFLFLQCVYIFGYTMKGRIQELQIFSVEKWHHNVQ